MILMPQFAATEVLGLRKCIVKANAQQKSLIAIIWYTFAKRPFWASGARCLCLALLVEPYRAILAFFGICVKYMPPITSHVAPQNSARCLDHERGLVENNKNIW
jgi:hypothetical protein